MNIFQFSAIVQSVENIVDFLREKRILCSSYQCCGKPCSIIKSHSSDGQMFRCATCRKKKSIRVGSFFSRSQLTLKVLLTIVYFFTQKAQVKDVLNYMKGEVSHMSVIQWFVFCREICSAYLLNTNEIVLGQSPGSVIQIDECFLGGKMKYHRGDPRRRAHQKILFGMIDSVTKKCVVRIVQDRKQVTLIPIIVKHADNDATIYSDEAQMYKILGRMGYTHRTVKHKTEFKAADGTHTNLIENLWSQIKFGNKKRRGTTSKMLSLHMDEFLYNWNTKDLPGNSFDRFLNHIQQYYVPRQ